MPRRNLIAAVTVLALASACVPAEKVENLGKRWDETTVMGELQSEGTIRVGVSLDSPTRVEGRAGAYDGFTMDFAHFLANTLGVELDVVEVPASQLQTGIDTGDIDIAFPVSPITEGSVRNQAFSDPLFVSHQRLLVHNNSDITAIDDLSGKAVCSLADTDTGFDPSSVDTSISVRTERDPEVCVSALESGDVAAVTGPEIVLLAVKAVGDSLCSEFGCGTEGATSYEIVGDELTTAGLGVQLKTGAQAWVDYVNLVIEKWIAEGGWADSYAAHFGSTTEPPDLTVEEAAALFPL